MCVSTIPFEESECLNTAMTEARSDAANGKMDTLENLLRVTPAQSDWMLRGTGSTDITLPDSPTRRAEGSEYVPMFAPMSSTTSPAFSESRKSGRTWDSYVPVAAT